MNKNISLESASGSDGIIVVLKDKIAFNPVYRVLIALLIIFAVFTLRSKDFLGPVIFPGILLLGAELAILAIGETLVIIAGEIDLSIASVYGWGALCAMLPSNAGLPYPLSVLIAIAFGCGIGFLNWLVTVKFRVPALITTLGSMWAFRGLLMGMFATTFMSYKGGESVLLRAFGGNNIGIFPKLFFWFLLIVGIFHILLNFTKLGNWVYATGGQREIARALGVNTNKTKLVCFMISGGLAAFAGAAYLGRMDWFMPWLGMSTMGFGLETEAIVASVMGGTAFTGGQGNLIAVCLAAFALSSFRSGLILIGMSSYWIDGALAVLLITFCIIRSIGQAR
jgi:ribose/xylose/arabinose/galactoside ABC-type transport system permease subunit